MKIRFSALRCQRLPAALAFAAAVLVPFQAAKAAFYPAESLTLEINGANNASQTLIGTGDDWRYFKGRNAPNAGWEVADDVFLGSSWATGRAGFGYGDGDDVTVLSDMRNSYSTVYIRRSLRVPGMVNPRRLKLRIDYDDGFVAWLDGKEIARANAPGAPDSIVPHTAVATAAHEASGGTGGNSVEIYILPETFGAVHRGTPSVNHVLAIQGINRSLDDDDFSLKAELVLDDYYTVATSSSINLSGQASTPGTARVTVNGVNANFNAGAKTWSGAANLVAGLNRLVAQAWDSGNNLLASTTNDVLYKPSTTVVGGTVNNTTWSPSLGVVEVNGHVRVANNATLTVAPGTTVLFRPGGGLYTEGGAIAINGTASQPVFLLPSDGHTAWDDIAANGAGSSISLRHAEMVEGGIHITNDVVMLIEDSVLRDGSHTRFGLEQQILYSAVYCEVTMRRTTVTRFYEMSLGAETLVRFEDCLVQFAEDDAIKLDDSSPGSYIRGCTVGPSAPGDDAIDFGVGARATVANCHIHHIFDRGISIGEVANVVVTNCLIHHTGNAIGVKDSATADIRNVTLADSSIGLAVYEKFAGGGASFAWVTNAIIWGNGTNLTTRHPEDGDTSGSRIYLGYSIAQGSPVYAGTANLNSNPQFANASQGQYQLNAGSPGIGSGLGGLNRGVLFPVGLNTGLNILQPPMSQTVALHGILNLTVSASGVGPLSYQWQLNGQNISGATSSTLAVSDFQGHKEGLYRVRVTDSSGSVFSAPALVLLNSPLRIIYAMEKPTLHLRLVGPSASTFVLQSSSNFQSWTGHSTNAAPNGMVDVSVPLSPTGAGLFYRIKQ